MSEHLSHHVVFRVPASYWDRGELCSSELDDWSDRTGVRLQPCMELNPRDTEFRAFVAATSSEEDAAKFRAFLRSVPKVEVAFDPQAQPRRPRRRRA